MLVRRNYLFFKNIFSFSLKDKAFSHHPVIIDKHELIYEYPDENNFFGKNAVIIRHKSANVEVIIKDGESLEKCKKEALKLLKEKLDHQMNKEYYHMKEKHDKLQKEKGDRRRKEFESSSHLNPSNEKEDNNNDNNGSNDKQ